MKQYSVVRYGMGRNSTLGILTRLHGGDEEELCFTLEDERRTTKVQGETCIPVGSYELKLRTDGMDNMNTMNGRYRNRFGSRHKGMIWLQEVPDFTWVYIHIGNDEDETEGCILTGKIPQISLDGEFSVGNSTEAYWKVYEEIAPALIAGEKVILHVTEMQPWA